MRVQWLVIVTVTSIMSVAHAQEDTPEVVQQISTTQAHLRAMNPGDGRPGGSVAPLMARLLGKVLSEQFKDVRIDLESDGAPSNSMAPTPGALHLNRRAEICFDNYRLGFKRDGVVMRYERSF